MTDYTSNTQDVRELARSVGALTFPDGEIIEEQKAAFTYIGIGTHKFDWDSDDEEWEAIQKLEAQIAKCYILEHYGGGKYQEYVDSKMLQFDRQIATIKDNMSSVPTDEEGILTRTDLKSWNIGPDGYYSKLNRSLRTDTMGETD